MHVCNVCACMQHMHTIKMHAWNVYACKPGWNWMYAMFMHACSTCIQIKMHACNICACMHAVHAYNQDACMECLCMHVVHVGIQMKMHACNVYACKPGWNLMYAMFMYACSTCIQSRCMHAMFVHVNQDECMQCLCMHAWCMHAVCMMHACSTWMQTWGCMHSYFGRRYKNVHTYSSGAKGTRLLEGLRVCYPRKIFECWNLCNAISCILRWVFKSLEVINKTKKKHK